MKAFFWLGLLLLCIGIIIFGLENRQEVDIRLFGTVFPGVKVMYVAFLSVLVGVAFTAIIAIAEGARIRLGNRRLKREVARLESELQHIRTQSAQASAAPEMARSETGKSNGVATGNSQGAKAAAPATPTTQDNSGLQTRAGAEASTGAQAKGLASAGSVEASDSTRPASETS